jgi:hypothetical protein
MKVIFHAVRLRAAVPYAIAVGISAACIFWGPPRMRDLVIVEGPLESYSLYRTQSRHPYLDAIIRIGGQPGRFWNDGLKGALIHRLDGKVGSIIRIMYAPTERARPIAGDAVKSYGLRIDGVELKSAEEDLQEDQILAYAVMPILAALLGVIVHYRLKSYARTGGILDVSDPQ